MSANWLNKILGHQVTPPEGVWVNITNELDKENETGATDFKTKMLAFETTAPDKVLVNIFKTLDEEEQPANSFTERLYNYNAAAPADAWKNIATQLDKSETRVVPLQDNKKNQKVIYFRMAAAASVIAIIATTVWLSSIKKDDAINSTASSVTPQSQQLIPVAGQEKTTLPASDTQEKKLAKEQTAYNPNPAKKTTALQTEETLVTDYLKGNKAEDLAQDPAIGNKEKLQTANGETPMDIALMNTPNTYISITGPDGQTIKVSSKFSNLIGYLTDKNPELQENLDVIIKESAKWKNTFAKWRDKMTNNAVAPSLSNFMDIIELSNILEEKK